MSDMISREDVLNILGEQTYCCDAEELILALPAVQPKVKPLVWEDRGATVNHQFKATTAFGVYYVERDKSGLFNWWTPALRGKVQAHTLQAAKAAAQADYEARILSALEPAVQPDAELAMRIAVEMEVHAALGTTTKEKADAILALLLVSLCAEGQQP